MSESPLSDNVVPQHNVKFVRKEHKHMRHDNGDKKGSPDLRYCELCISVRNGTGFCTYGDKCLFAHSVEQLRPREQHAKYKTSFCQNYHSRKYCPFGTRCTYIHDEFRIVNNGEVWLVSPSEGLVRIETGVPLSIVNATSAANNPSATAAVVAAATEAVHAASKEMEKNKEDVSPEGTPSDVDSTAQPESSGSSESNPELSPSTSTSSSPEAPSSTQSSSTASMAVTAPVAQFSRRGKRSIPPRVEVATTPASAAAIAAAFGLRNVHNIAPGTSFVHEMGVTVMTPYNADSAAPATPASPALKSDTEKPAAEVSADADVPAEATDATEAKDGKLQKRPSASAQPFVPMAQKPVPVKPNFHAPMPFKVRKQPHYPPYMRNAPMDKHMMPLPPHAPRPRFSPGMPMTPHMMPMPVAYGIPMRRKPNFSPYTQPVPKAYNKQFAPRPKKTVVMPPTYSQIVSQNVPSLQSAAPATPPTVDASSSESRKNVVEVPQTA